MISRDPRDILVSYYFELTKRTKNSFSGSISDFIRNEAYGIRPLLEYYNDWYTFRHELKDFLVITYEDLSFDTFSEINKLIHFFGLSNDITDEMIEQAIEFSRFENMRKIEIEDKKKNLLSSYHGSFGRRHKVEQSTSLRTRKGKVGGYRDYLSDEDIQYLDAEIKQNLHSFFSEQTKRQQIAT